MISESKSKFLNFKLINAPTVFLALAALLLTALTFLGQPQPLRLWAAVGLLWIAPGINWALALADRPRLERIALGLGLAFAISGLVTLLLHLLPGPFPATIARLCYLLAAIAPLFLIPNLHSLLPTWQSQNQNHQGHKKHKGFYFVSLVPFVVKFFDRKAKNLPKILLAILLIAALARLPNLGYSEFQGDEGIIMQRAAQAIAGDDGQLFLHQKGPAEILAPLSLWALTGSINEPQARLPFALMGLLAVLAVMLLAERWFDTRAANLAGLLVAISGFLVAFARIVQYQNVVVALGALALLALTAYARRGQLSDLLLAAVLLAYGLLAHYDAILIAPAALWLVAVGLFARRATWKRELVRLAAAAVIGAAVLAVFYAPFVTNPNFAKTFSYLAGDRMGGGGPFYNNTSRVWIMSTFYNSTYYVAGLLVLLGLSAAWTIKAILQRTARLTAHTWTAWLYLGAPLLFYLFLVFDPRTHIYTFYPGAAVLAGAAASGAWEWLQARWRKLALLLAALGLAWYALCAGYIGLAFVGHAPEYKREWPASASPLYPTTFQELPLFGFFGFPYRAGWKAVDQLYAQGTLSGTYNSNEEPEITTWYVRSGARTLCGRPDWYILAEHVQDELALDYDELKRDYHLAFQVTVEGQPKLHIYQHGAGLAGEPVVFNAQDFGRAFDQNTTIVAQLPSTYGGAQPVGATFGSLTRLLGYDLSSASIKPGDSLVVTLYWQVLSPPGRNYQVFTHLVGGGKLLAQHDGAPACSLQPTSGWEPGKIVRDEHVIATGGDIPPGKAELYVGMYDLITLARLPLTNASGDMLRLTEIEVLP